MLAAAAPMVGSSTQGTMSEATTVASAALSRSEGIYVGGEGTEPVEEMLVEPPEIMVVGSKRVVA